MAARAKLAANLPAAPLTTGQRALFDQHLPLAERMASRAIRKYGYEMRKVLRCAAFTGLMCAASRYREPSEASFRTFAIHTINWVMRLEVRRELGQKSQDPDRRREYARRKFDQKPIQTFEPSAYRASGDLADVVTVANGEVWSVLQVTHVNPEQLLENKREQLLARRALRRLRREQPRNARILERWLNDETFASIGGHYKISRQRVQQLVRKMLANAALTVRQVA